MVLDIVVVAAVLALSMVLPIIEVPIVAMVPK